MALELELELDDSEYDFGETIDVSFSVESEKPKKIKGVRVELINDGTVIESERKAIGMLDSDEKEFEFEIRIPHRGRSSEYGGKWKVRGVVEIPWWFNSKVEKHITIEEP